MAYNDIMWSAMFHISRSYHRSVAVYFIDKLALRAGNEKDSDETADTVGCCSLRVEHLSKNCLLYQRLIQYVNYKYLY